MNRGTWEMIAAMAICGTIGLTVLLSGQSQIDAIFYRCLFGAAVLTGVVVWKGYLRSHLTGSVMLFAALGGMALLANWYFLFSSYRNTSVGIATTVYNTQPLMMIAFGVFLFKEKVTGSVLCWAGVSLVGLLFISKALAGGDFELTSSYILGIIEALLAAFLYAIAAIIARKLKSTPPALIAFVQLIIGTMVLFPFADLAVITSPRFDSATIAMVLLGVVHTGLMYVLLYGAIQKIEAWRVASISFLYPAIAIVLDAAFLHVQLGASQWAGILLVLTGAAGINLRWTFTVPTIHYRRS
ncbi:DMT family transporter [Fulvimarina sp. 2208YS6-2-32]|uniref:DMT family transporter n=1 Tax=Fulvimarina uroteuthidis TaxID=3098149 RepID=A0ABU5I1M2_9HYPH|nr:DMT family transporter [Fulvimarina sp. 2208YS6-2-32]MDY8109277.1 DMT family transporter [Fulvimarina sp. 2208YS6-2-32]